MKINFKFRILLIASIILVGLISIPLSFVKADSGVSLYVTPSSGNYNVGNLINVSVKINTEGETINAVKATLSFNKNLKVRSISKSGSILGLWIEDPSYDNSLRTISFGGAGAGTTYKGSGGKIISITFKAEKAGKGTISFSSNSVKYGATTIAVDSATGASYTINVSCSCTSWQDKACGEDDCSLNQRLQTRICSPSGCLLENRCINDSTCVSRPPLVEEEEEGEEEQEEEEIIEESAEKEVVVTPRERVVQEGLLANLAIFWGGTKQLTLMIVIVVLCMTALVFMGIKEWKLFQKKKKK